MSSRIEQIIEEIEEYVDSCKYQPLSTTKIVVNKEEMEELLRELRLKTPEEIKSGLECWANDSGCTGSSCPYGGILACEKKIGKDALEYINELEAKQQKWISVEERMPEHGTDVLVLTAPGTLSLGKNCVVAEYIHPRMEKSGVFINFYAGYDDKNILAVTHWMPLPEPPDGKKSNEDD